MKCHLSSAYGCGNVLEPSPQIPALLPAQPTKSNGSNQHVILIPPVTGGTHTHTHTHTQTHTHTCSTQYSTIQKVGARGVFARSWQSSDPAAQTRTRHAHTQHTDRKHSATGAQGSLQPGFNQVIPLHQRAPLCDVSLTSLLKGVSRCTKGPVAQYTQHKGTRTHARTPCRPGLLPRLLLW